MTKQDPHTCDVCGDLFYIPQDTQRSMKVYENDKEKLDYDLCFDCHSKLMKWIMAMRKEKETAQS